MRIYPKTLLTLAITLFCLVFVLLIVTEQVIGNSYLSLEEETLSQNVQRAAGAIEYQTEVIDMTGASYAIWDDTFYFMQGGNNSYIEKNIVPEGLVSMQVNMMLFYDTSRQLYYASGVDFSTYEEKEISSSLLEYFISNEALFDHPSNITSENHIVGILNSPEGPLLLSSWPILKTSGEGPVAGTLIVARYMDPFWLEELEKTTLLDLNTGFFTADDKASEYKVSTSYLSETEELNINYVSEDLVTGTTVLNDINGNPALALDVVMPRTIYQHGKSSVQFIIYTFLAIGVIFGIVLSFSLERSVLSRLKLLSNNLSNITASKSISSRVEISGNDELHDLAVNVNNMLQTLESEAKVHEILELMESSLESINAGLMIVDKDSQLIMNNKFIKMWNIHIELMFQNDVSKVLEHIAAQTDITEGTAELIEEMKTHSSGSSISLNLKNNAVYEWYVGPLYQNKDAVGTIYCVNDLTKIKEAEKSLIQAKMDAETANRVKSEFLATMSHELRTPLNSIIGFSDAMLEGYAGELSPKQNHYLQHMSNSGKHLLSLINNVLDLSKIEAEKMELNCELFSVHYTIDEVKQLVSPIADKKGLKMEFARDERLDKIYADRIRFKQILFNLASNAIKFTPQGGKVTICAHIIDSMAQFTVTDTGIGISEEDKSKLFQPFMQLDSAVNRKYEGTGLGLSLVKQFVEMHKGRIWFESELGKGTSFTFELPLQFKADKENTGKTKPTELPSLKPEIKDINPATEPSISGSTTPLKESVPTVREPPYARGDEPLILVVEDDYASRELLEVTLVHEGYRVATAANGKEALELADKMKPFAITLDIMMPGMDGWEVLKQLKEKQQTHDIPVIITSMLDERELGVVWGAFDYFTKPIQKDSLLKSLQKIKGHIGKSSIRVLVVDDEVSAVEMIASMLATEGSDVLKAYGGKEAIDIASRERPDVIILDLMMPEVSGFGVIEALKGNQETIDIPIIICTAKMLDKADMDLLNGKVSGIMTKSMFTKEELIAHIKQLQKANKKTKQGIGCV